MANFINLPDNPTLVQFLRTPKAANDDDWNPPKEYA